MAVSDKAETIDAKSDVQKPIEGAPALTVNDLALVANIIDLAVQRGAFKGAEAETVGAAFKKVVAIVKHLAPPKEESKEESKADDKKSAGE
tara:strand:+ start:7873 stop:8145 length:273 start_codon:yes stop_codon:yes gene_type:complete